MFKKAKWVDVDSETYINGERVQVKKCSHCGHSNLFNGVGEPWYSKYCPDCGYKMKEYSKSNSEYRRDV